MGLKGKVAIRVPSSARSSPHNILVVGVGPGAVATPINLSTMNDPMLMK